jgi:aminopeptidase N
MVRLIVCIVCTTALLFAQTCGATPAGAESGPAPDERSIPTFLPGNARPSHYAITIAPDAGALTFKGKVAIDLTIRLPTSQLTFNAADLTFSQGQIRTGGGEVRTGKIVTDSTAQTATISFPESLPEGKYVLELSYDGLISTQANGLFALDYQNDKGVQKRALFTQFEASDARRFVPSWDEPRYKATYDLSAIIPTGQLAVSNMPVVSRTDMEGGKTKVTFATSSVMSSYLLFFGVGELERISSKAGASEVGIITSKGQSAKARPALEATARILPWYNDYFGTPYPLPKLDNIAGPGQSQFFSAMENWGAIFTFEYALLSDPDFTSEARQREIYLTLAHEMSHQWFGNLVTMAWWDDLWLNEGFASWMESKATDKLHPEWEVLLGRIGSRERVMYLDALTTTHPVVQKINSIDDINQAFDEIAYFKGQATITMLEAFAGEKVWRDGIRKYIRENAYGNTTTEDLWQAVESAGAKGIGGIARDFTTQPGIPLVRIERSECRNGRTRLVLSQDEFSRENKVKAPLRWRVPLSAKTVGHAARQIVLDGSGTIEMPGCGPYIVNEGQSGYYRTLYPAGDLSGLSVAFGNLSAADQIGLISDNWALAYSDYQPMAPVLKVMDKVPPGTNQSVLSVLSDYLLKNYTVLEGDPALQAEYAGYISEKLDPALLATGLDAKPGDSPQAPLLREKLISVLGQTGDPRVLAEARRRFDALDTDPKTLDGPLKTVWLTVIAINADQPVWDKLRAMANAAPTALEKAEMFALLGRAKDKTLAAQSLALALTDEPGKTMGASIISAVSFDHSMMAVDFVLAHREQVEAMIDSTARTTFVAELGRGSGDLAMAAKLDAYASAYLTPESRKAVDRSIAAVKARFKACERLRPDIGDWLTRRD